MVSLRKLLKTHNLRQTNMKQMLVSYDLVVINKVLDKMFQCILFFLKEKQLITVLSVCHKYTYLPCMHLLSWFLIP